ncbi:MAG: tripartite tricarboxylate transporter substrate binding protein [Bradyrhizobium sp.]|nr:tripartite tricarboxylate transporter substrate binding protein [Bradyrhizobium sp.]
MALPPGKISMPFSPLHEHTPFRKAASKAIILMLSGSLLVAATAGNALAQATYPSTTIKIVVGFPAGTVPDTLARLLADGFQVSLGQPVVVENAVGAGGNIATDRVAKAEPDGHTLLMAGNAALVVNPSLYAKLPFDPKKDLVPISQVAVTPNLLVVHPDVQANSVQELVALAKAKPDELAYAHVGLGTSQHLAAELLKISSGIAMQGVFYRGGNTALPDLISGRVQVCFCNIATTAPLVKDGKLRGLAVTSPTRSPIAPDLPTMQEAGFPGFSADAWFGLAAPVGTPGAVVTRLHAEVAKLLSEPSLQKTMKELGMVPRGNSPEDFAQVIETEREYWATKIKSMGLTIQ